MKAQFLALIKQITSKSLVSGDKSARVILEFDAPSDELMDSLNRLHRGDELVEVNIQNCKEQG